ncbi:hypothetical protein [Lentzea atacamensis]|uniref:hypothetical protein n=1 Tax=Lentzea atacamensis TaxID=531938 RepID=UPI0011B4C7A5|nr:hypothetical protein [Lentzea atacamensis]
MSVDARTLTITEDVLKPGTKSAKLAFNRTEDAYLVQNIAWSFPLPELTLAVDPKHPTAYPKATVTQTATVTNAGDAAAANVSVCGQKIGTIPPTRESHPRLHDTSGGRRLPDHGHRKRHQRSRRPARCTEERTGRRASSGIARNHGNRADDRPPRTESQILNNCHEHRRYTVVRPQGAHNN